MFAGFKNSVTCLLSKLSWRDFAGDKISVRDFGKTTIQNEFIFVHIKIKNKLQIQKAFTRKKMDVFDN